MQIQPKLTATFTAGLLTLAFGLPATADPGIISEALFSPDVTVELGALTLPDENVAYEDFSTAISPWVFIPLPEHVDVVAYHLDVSGDGTVYFSVDVTSQVGAGLTITPRDVVAYDFTNFSIKIAGDDLGVPVGARIDAMSVEPTTGEFILSFDTTVSLGGTVFDDEDLALIDGAPASLYLDGSALGVAPALDVDGASVLADGFVVMSFDGSGVLGGITFDDEDLLLYSSLTGAWMMAYDASSWAPGMAGGPDTDLVFVPEPGHGALGVTGMALLVWLARRRKHLTTSTLLPTAAATALALGLSPQAASASDGVLEINQASVSAFPYVISQSGSYVLTGDLAVSNFGTSAIRIDVDDVTLDLNGFRIHYVFTGGSVAAGIDATGRARITIRNGRVGRFAGDCIVAGSRAVVFDVVVSSCSASGLRLGAYATARRVGAHQNGSHGIWTDSNSHIVDSMAANNGGDGIRGAGKIADNVTSWNSGDGIHTTDSGYVTGNMGDDNAGHDLGTSLFGCVTIPPPTPPLPYVRLGGNKLDHIQTSTCWLAD